jgi:hypothetical protein
MTKRFISLALALLLAHAGAAAASAKTRAEKEAERAEKVKRAVLSLGTGEQALVKVGLRDGTRLEGYVGAAGDSSFTVVSRRTGAAAVVAYPQVGQVKGHNLSTGAKIAIGVGIAVLVIAILWAAADKDFTN